MIHLNLSGYTPEEAYELMLIGLISQKAKIDSVIEGLKQELNGGADTFPPTYKELRINLPELPKRKKEGMGHRRRLSPEGRKRIAAASKKRWAAYRKAAKKK